MKRTLTVAALVVVTVAAIAQAVLQVRVTGNAPVVLRHELGTNGWFQAEFNGEYRHVGNGLFKQDGFVMSVSQVDGETYEVTFTKNGNALSVEFIE